MGLYNFVRSVASVLFKMLYRVKVHGDKNVLVDSRMIICSNHIHYFDPVLVAVIFKNSQVHYIAKKELFKHKILGSFIEKLGTFPVDRDGADLSAIKRALKILKSDKVLGIFPEGKRVVKGEKIEAKPGVAMIAVKSKSPVVPVYIDTSYKLFSEINVYLGQPMELHNNQKGKLSIEEYKSISDDILKKIYSLKSNG
ncbi:1-acyl-sn-glycerol-3-phosphate acyltransferase [Clostridium sp. D2Q-11]|uniref:1-acyl-sn-glycerol-3-phosphate acyltransferase n=1 Tax=Anaeromonas frigoriresistens TaxID=2683708 RepID=A0A942UXJ6_9FIRM|nr:lysophospholipid acyltransferase family protein [Anaeromonas frigoriresistens]MBS4539940.1 1-acyl-sn-glycerol-3-phosphate acyltransferase [Anaeromonas frigoriresistens]